MQHAVRWAFYFCFLILIKYEIRSYIFFVRSLRQIQIWNWNELYWFSFYPLVQLNALHFGRYFNVHIFLFRMWIWCMAKTQDVRRMNALPTNKTLIWFFSPPPRIFQWDACVCLCAILIFVFSMIIKCKFDSHQVEFMKFEKFIAWNTPRCGTVMCGINKNAFNKFMLETILEQRKDCVWQEIRVYIYIYIHIMGVMRLREHYYYCCYAKWYDVPFNLTRLRTIQHYYILFINTSISRKQWQLCIT